MEYLNTKTKQYVNVNGSNFIEHIKAKWEEIHSDTNVFRYKLCTMEERLVDKKYLLQLNPNRNTKRRTPEEVDNIIQQFDENKFNFTNVSDTEIVCTLKEVNDDDIHTLLVNVSPISRYHILLCPSLNKCMPQVITKNSLRLVINLMLLAEDRDLRIGFNSLCAMASVNHLHYHLLFEKNKLPVETLKCKQLKGVLYCFENYPASAFCFEVTKTSPKIDEIYKLLEFLLRKSIAHNILITRGCSVEGNFENTGQFRVVVWPRKSTFGAKKIAAFNVAVVEFSGWFPVYNPEDYYNLQTDRLENELKKWEINNFDDLCEEVILLY